MSATRIPLNFFGMPFGLAGLGGSWLAMAEFGHAPKAVGDVLLAAAAVVWLVLLVGYLRYVLSDRPGRRQPERSAQPDGSAPAARSALVRDLLDPVAAPFASLILITPMLLAAEGLYPQAPTAGRALTDVFLVLAVLLGAWFTGQWIYGPMELDKFHPGYFLPTVAGGLLASATAAEVGQRLLAEVMFGYGVFCWLVLGSIILGRLLMRPQLPQALLPTLAIEVAPAAVATLAYFALHGDHIDPIVAFLAGYGILMVLAQLRLLPAFRRLPFMPSTWAFTFSWAAVATAGLNWLNATRPTGYRVYEDVVLALITVLIGAIAARTVVAVKRGQLFPNPPTAPTAPLPTDAPSTSPALAGR